MPISFACPSCGKTLKAPDNAAGRSLKCPNCKAAVTTPTARTDPPSPTWKAVDEPAPKTPPARRNNRLLLYGGIAAGVVCLVLVIGTAAVIGVVVLSKRQPAESLADADAGPKPVMTLAAYLAQRPASGARITGKCEIFQNSGGMYGATIYADGKLDHIFADSDSKAGQELMNALKDGKPHVITVEIRPTTYKNRAGEERDGSLVLRVVGEQADAAPPKNDVAQRDDPKPDRPAKPDQPKPEPPKPEPPKERPRPGQPFARVVEREIHGHFGNDTIGAEKKYVNKIVAVEGFISKVEKADDGRYVAFMTIPVQSGDIVNKVGLRIDNMVCLHCYVHPSAVDDFSRDGLLKYRFNKGGFTTFLVNGTCRGVTRKGSDLYNKFAVVMDDCVLLWPPEVPKPGEKPEPAEPAKPAKPAPAPPLPEEERNLKELQAKKRVGSFTVRGSCQVTTHYASEYAKADKTHLSVRLTQASGAAVHCYISRESDDGKKLAELLDKGEKKLTLEIDFGTNTRVAKIVRVVKWE